jgi:hypothetical protein
MANLHLLNASYDSGICDFGIKDLNLVTLHAQYNKKIKNVNHMTNLKTVDARGYCGISNDGIKNLKLTKLYSSGNPKITVCI